MLLSSLISLKMLSIIMTDGTKCASDWMIHRRGPSDVIRRSLASGESSILSWASGPQPAHVTTECDRLVKQCAIVFSTRVYFILPETVELNGREVS